MKRFYTWINELNFLFWKRIVQSTYLDLKSLSVFRVLMGLFLLITYVPSYGWIADVPKSFFHPPVFSLANLFNSFPNKMFFYNLDYIIFISLVCLTLGIKSRFVALVYLGACLVGLNFQYSFGKISHVILSYLMVGCMAFSGWGRHLAIVPDNESKLDNTSKSLSLFAVLICFGMFSAGFEKGLQWIDLDMTLNGFLLWSQNSIVNANKVYLLAPYVKYFPPIVLELFDYTAVFFELSPILFLLYSRTSWKIWLLMASVFHLSNTFLLNIPFPLHSIVYLVFVDFTWLYENLKKNLKKHSYKLIIISTLVFVSLARFTYILLIQFSGSIFLTQKDSALLNLYFSIGLWTCVIILLAKNIIQEYKSGNFRALVKEKHKKLTII